MPCVSHSAHYFVWHMLALKGDAGARQVTTTTSWRHLPPGGGNGNLDPRVFVYGVKPGTANSDITKACLAKTACSAPIAAPMQLAVQL